MDTGKIIKIEELEIGDEILLASNCHIRYYRVLRKPKLNSKTNRWSGVRCSTCGEEKTYKKYVGKRWEKEVTNTIYLCTSENHNIEKMMYIHHRDMWLVKREGKW